MRTKNKLTKALKTWTKEEEAELLKVYKNLTEEELAEKFGRELPSIKAKYYRLIKENKKDNGGKKAKKTMKLFISPKIKIEKNISEEAKRICRCLINGYDEKYELYYLYFFGEYQVISTNEENKYSGLYFSAAWRFESYLRGANNLITVEDMIMIKHYIKEMKKSFQHSLYNQKNFI